MIGSLRKYILSAVLALAFTSAGFATRAYAQTYQIDCAILLCLSGGWPASVPCARARAEFIRRITPWPIEPPLQIWRCPMRASYQNPISKQTPGPVVDVLYGVEGSFRLVSRTLGQVLEEAQHRFEPRFSLSLANSRTKYELMEVLERADINISGPEFDFVRSIRVFDVRFAYQYEAGSDGGCERSAAVTVGTYGLQGSFSWRPTTVDVVPSAHTGLEGWGQNCPNISHRSVFVEWYDFSGAYGFEQVYY